MDYMPGTLVTPASRLADQYLASHGVSFSSGAGFAALLNLGANHAHSGRIGVVGTSSNGLVNYGVELRVSFFDVLTGSAGVTDFVSWTTDRLGDNRDVTLKAYGVDGQFIAQQTWADSGWKQISLSAQGIHSVVFSGTGYAALDDLSFNPIRNPASPVPEPNSGALVLAGMGIVWMDTLRRLGRERQA